MSSDRKIKKFYEFMSGTRIHRVLNMTIISGNLKGFLTKKRPFELYLYTSKGKIIDFRIKGLNINDLKLNIKFGDDVDLYKNWAIKNKYEIEDFVR